MSGGLEPKARPGRKQTIVAKAWIGRKQRGACFTSHISLGKGRVYELSTGTLRRELALDFCRLHLAHHLKHGDTPYKPIAGGQTAQKELFP